MLNSRSGIKNGYQMYRINLWRSYGVNVQVSDEDVTKRTQVEILLHKAAALGPIAGVFNLAAVCIIIFIEFVSDQMLFTSGFEYLE